MITASSDPRTLGRSFGVHRTLDTDRRRPRAAPRVRRPVGHPRRLPDGVRHLVRLRRHRARRARPAGARPAPAPGGLAHAAPVARGPQAAQVQGLQLRHPRARARRPAVQLVVPHRAGPAPHLRDGRRPRPAHRRRRLHLPVPAGARRLRDPVVPAPVRRARTSPTCRSRSPSAGWRTGSAGRGSSSGATPRSWSPTCAPASRPPSAATTVAALLLLGLFYAATDGVLAALVGRRAAPNVRASAIGTAQTVVAVARMASSALFGLLWYTVGRGPAILTVAVLLACAVPVAWYVVRGLDAPVPEPVDAEAAGEARAAARRDPRRRHGRRRRRDGRLRRRGLASEPRRRSSPRRPSRRPPWTPCSPGRTSCSARPCPATSTAWSPRCRSTTRTARARSRTSPATGSTSPARSPRACARSPASPPGGRPRCWTPTGSPSRRGACPGIPSRTRLSDDGTLVATTSFVTGHSYATVGFSTLTEIHRADGTSLGNVEDFALTVDGAPFTAADRNIWGVTFVDDDDVLRDRRLAVRRHDVAGARAPSRTGP